MHLTAATHEASYHAAHTSTNLCRCQRKPSRPAGMHERDKQQPAGAVVLEHVQLPLPFLGRVGLTQVGDGEAALFLQGRRSIPAAMVVSALRMGMPKACCTPSLCHSTHRRKRFSWVIQSNNPISVAGLIAGSLPEHPVPATEDDHLATWRGAMKEVG
jgi:hypothetical protein